MLYTILVSEEKGSIIAVTYNFTLSGPDGSDEPDEAASKSRKRKSSGSAPKRRVLKRHSSSSK